MFGALVPGLAEPDGAPVFEAGQAGRQLGFRAPARRDDKFTRFAAIERKHHTAGYNLLDEKVVTSEPNAVMEGCRFWLSMTSNF